MSCTDAYTISILTTYQRNINDCWLLITINSISGASEGGKHHTCTYPVPTNNFSQQFLFKSSILTPSVLRTARFH